MRPIFGISLVAAAGVTLFLFLMPQTIVISPATVPDKQASAANLAVSPAINTANLPQIPEPQASVSVPIVASGKTANHDLPNQESLANPPAVIKGIYVTSWSAGSASRMSSLMALIGRTELNAVVIDIKDFSGHVSYRTGLPEIAATGAEDEIRIAKPNALIKKLHDAGIYVIARQTVFQDPILAKAHPEWALHNASSGKVWLDNKGLAWMDPAAKYVWDYNVAIAKDALARGFDEVQFDYVRFASDGDLGKLSYPFWGRKTARHKIIGQFFKYLRDSLPGAKLSADLFGLSTIDTWDDLGIGQIIEDAYKYFDYVSPMVYPSHYATGFMGYKKPALYPYEVVKYSMEKALARLIEMTSDPAGKQASNGAGKRQATSSLATSSAQEDLSLNSQFSILNSKLRPWLQDFDLGAIYDANMVKKQIDASYDALVNATSSAGGSRFAGWLLWDPANTYIEGGLEARK